MESQVDALGEIIRGLEVELAAAHGGPQRPVPLVCPRAAYTLRQVSFDPQRVQQIELAIQVTMYQRVILFAAHVRAPSSPLESAVVEDVRDRVPDGTSRYPPVYPPDQRSLCKTSLPVRAGQVFHGTPRATFLEHL